MKFWRSVVGKLWFTILLLVSVVLFILTVTLLEYFENYHMNETETELESISHKVAKIIESHELDLGFAISWELLDDVTNATIVLHNEGTHYSPEKENSVHILEKDLRNDPDLRSVFQGEEIVKRNISLTDYSPGNPDHTKMMIIGVPLFQGEKQFGAVFIYQSVEVMQETSQSTTKFILLAACVAIILTTIFAFFLLTRINAPLRKMREAAFEVAKGKFDTKVPILTKDEIGELAIAFNQMGIQLKLNINALNQEKEQLANILREMADGVITFNRNGVILITNPPAERFLKNWYYEREETDVKNLVVPAKFKELFQQVIDSGKEQMGEIALQGRVWGIIISPLYSNKDIRGAVAVIRDMTEERKLDKLRNDFISNVSHELRTPISMMQGYSEAIVDDIAQSDEEKKEMARVIYDESLRMGRLVNELLDLGRMEAGHFTLKYENVNVSDFLQKIIRKFQGLAKDKQISLAVELQHQELMFLFDPDRIEQVLTNLIDNGLRHTPASGKIVVKEKSNQRGLFIEVTDSGSGIPEEDLPFVFERFYKADKARTRGRSGTGLGLAIAKNIIEAHKGQISVQSKEGHGTTFSFFIPQNIE
ncbi:HAMP domain-containing protein [Bacillaceae bacterium Marseille-Q3522]|nr:HAMP domain-containing protein [Bacillaceae bacterium Marseille-Q3522]